MSTTVTVGRAVYLSNADEGYRTTTLVGRCRGGDHSWLAVGPDAGGAAWPRIGQQCLCGLEVWAEGLVPEGDRS